MEHTAANETVAKKKSVIASERQRPDILLARESFFAEALKDVPLKDIVVLDESYATTQFTRLRGRCPRSERLKASVPYGHWKTLTMLAAITIEGVQAAASIDAATDRDTFPLFIQEVLLPALRPGMVIVMDNLAAHKMTVIGQLIQAAGCRLVYLPAYSPDLSPIENIWSKIKQLLRSTAAREVAALGDAITTAVARITASDCHHCFEACGYTLHLK